MGYYFRSARIHYATEKCSPWSRCEERGKRGSCFHSTVRRPAGEMPQEQDPRDPARREAVDVLCSEKGLIAEGEGRSLFLVCNSSLQAPPPDSGMREEGGRVLWLSNVPSAELDISLSSFRFVLTNKIQVALSPFYRLGKGPPLSLRRWPKCLSARV